MTTALIRVEDLHKQYVTPAGSVHVLRGIDLTIQTGEFVAIMGPSGSGKSTFMNILGCLDMPSAGHYVLDGRDVSKLSRDELAHLRNEVIGFVFQGFNLLMRANLEDNVALPLVYRGLGRTARRARAMAMLDKVGLAKFAAAYPNHVSGGQQQRVAIARALVNEPKLILADEPTGNLDTKTSDDIMRVFETLNREEGITVIIVTHERDVAAYAKRLIQIVDGRVLSDAPVAQRRLVGAAA
jgi:putative ABC transport system ATP-binding protein